MYVALYIAEAEIKVMDARGILDFCIEETVFIHRPRLADVDRTDNGTVYPIKTEGEGGIARGGSHDAKLLGSRAEIHSP